MTTMLPHYIGDKNRRKFSPVIWADFPVGYVKSGDVDGILIEDDFHLWPMTTGYHYTIDESDDKASATLLNAVDTPGGICRIAITGDDNEEVFIHAGGEEAYPFVISDTAAVAKRLCFECRFRVSAVTDNVCGIVFGLADTNLAIGGDDALQVDNTAALADIGFIGFQTLQADGDSLNFIYRKNGGAVQTVITGLDTIVADTWYNVGFSFDPMAPATKRIRAACVEHATTPVVTEGTSYVTATNIEAATFPDQVLLNFAAGCKVGSDAALNFDVDWWACGQLY